MKSVRPSLNSTRVLLLAALFFSLLALPFVQADPAVVQDRTQSYPEAHSSAVAAALAQQTASSQSTAAVDDIALCAAYVPYDTSSPEKTKCVVVFEESDTPVTPEDIALIMVFGPNNFEFDILNQPYSSQTYTGYLYTPGGGPLWYQGYRDGFPEDGYYVIDIVLADGNHLVKDRYVQKNMALLEAYLQYQTSMVFYPGVSQPLSGSAAILAWTTLKSLGGPDAYYNCWMRTTGVALSDRIFSRSEIYPAAGFNTGWSIKGIPQAPLSGGFYTWFVEILDANVFSSIDMVILQPWQGVIIY